MTSAQGLLDIGSESYADLQRFTKIPQDKKALRKFLGLKDEDEGIPFSKFERVKQRDKLRKRHEKAKDMFQRLTAQQKEGKNRHESSVQMIENGIREALQIPVESWIPQCHDTSLETVSGQLETYISQVNTILQTRELPNVSLLQNASGGLALQGILLSSNLEDQLESRGKLLQASEDIEFMMPFLLQCDETVEFSSKSQMDQFIKSMDRLGYSVTASTMRGFWGSSAESSTMYILKRVPKTIEFKAHQDEPSSFILKYSFVPLASCYFSNDQLLLSNDALKELQAIEKLITKEPDRTVHEQCTQFFHKYGSHANKGHLHFGGIYWHSALNQDNNPAKFPESGSASMNAALTGGPSDLSQWKTSLVASNSTWSLIDRGTNTVPVWDIIQVHVNVIQIPV